MSMPSTCRNERTTFFLENMQKATNPKSCQHKPFKLDNYKMVHTSRSRYDLRDSVSFNRVTLHLPLKKREIHFMKKHLNAHVIHKMVLLKLYTEFSLTLKNTGIIIMPFVF